MPVEVRLPTVLRQHAGGQSSVKANGATIGEVFEDLVRQFPLLAGQVVTEDGALHKFVNVYRNDDDVRYLDKLDTTVGRRRRRSRSCRPSPAARPAPAGGRLRLDPRPDRQHAAGRRQPAQPQPGGPHPGQARGPEPGRLGQGPHRPAHDRGGRGGRHAQARARPSSSRRRATPASAWPWCAGSRATSCKIVLPENVSIERRQLLEIFGAEIILSPGSRGLERGGADGRSGWPRSRPSWSFLFQYGNPANPRAHYEGTGPEIWRDCPEVTHFVAGLGTSGTLMGVGRYLKERNPAVQMWAVEPPAGEMVDGLRNLDDGFVPPIYDPDTARPQDHRPAPGVDRVDPPAGHRGGHLRRHLLGRGHGRRGQGRRRRSTRA